MSVNLARVEFWDETLLKATIFSIPGRKERDLRVCARQTRQKRFLNLPLPKASVIVTD